MENPNATPGTKTHRSDVQPTWREGFMGGQRTDFMRLSCSCLYRTHRARLCSSSDVIYRDRQICSVTHEDE